MQKLLNTKTTLADLLGKAEAENLGEGEDNGDEEGESEAPGEEGAEEDVVAASPSGSEPAATSARKAPHRQLRCSAASEDLGATAASMATPPSKRARSEGLRSLAGRLASPSMDPVEGKAAEWLAKLNLQGTMEGSQYKTELRWATDFLEKHMGDTPMVSKLRNHVKRAAAAADMTAAKVAACRQGDLTTNARTLKDAGTEFPTSIKTALLNRRLKEMSADKSKLVEDISDFMGAIVPVRKQAEDKTDGEDKEEAEEGDDDATHKKYEDMEGHEFDPEKPALAAVEGSDDELASIFLSSFATYGLLCMVAEGQKNLVKVIQAVNVVETYLDGLGLEIPTVYINVFEELLTTLWALCCLLDPADFDHLQDLNAVRTQERTKTPTHSTAALLDIMDDREYPSKLYKDFAMKSGSLATTQKEISSMMKSCYSCNTPTLLKMMSDFLALEAAFRAGATDGLRANLKCVVNNLLEKLAATNSEHRGDGEKKAELYSDGISILTKAAQIFPEFASTLRPNIVEYQKAAQAVRADMAGVALIEKLQLVGSADLSSSGALDSALQACDQYMSLSSVLPSIDGAGECVKKAVETMIEKLLARDWAGDAGELGGSVMKILGSLLKLLPKPERKAFEDATLTLEAGIKMLEAKGAWQKLGESIEHRFKNDSVQHSSVLELGGAAIRLEEAVNGIGDAYTEKVDKLKNLAAMCKAEYRQAGCIHIKQLAKGVGFRGGQQHPRALLAR